MSAIRISSRFAPPSLASRSPLASRAAELKCVTLAKRFAL